MLPTTADPSNSAGRELITLLDGAELRGVLRWVVPAPPPLATALASQDRQVLIGGGDGIIRIHAVESAGPVVGTFTAHTGTPIRFIRVAPDGRRVLSVAGMNLAIWDVQAPRSPLFQARIAPAVHPEHVMALDISPNWAWALIGDVGGNVTLWDMAAGKGPAREWTNPYPGSDDRIEQVAFSPDWRTSASVTREGRVRFHGLTAYTGKGRQPQPIRSAQEPATPSPKQPPPPRPSTRTSPTEKEKQKQPPLQRPPTSTSSAAAKTEQGPVFQHGFERYRATRDGRAVNLQAGFSVPLEKVAAPGGPRLVEIGETGEVQDRKGEPGSRQSEVGEGAPPKAPTLLPPRRRGEDSSLLSLGGAP